MAPTSGKDVEAGATSGLQGGQGDRRKRKQQDGEQSQVRDPAAVGRGSLLHQLQKQQRAAGDQQRFHCERKKILHYFAPLPFLAARAFAIIASSSSSWGVSSRSDIPSSAVAAPAGELLKKTRTTSDSADLRATESDTAGL